jgi:hypothetical protein
MYIYTYAYIGKAIIWKVMVKSMDINFGVNYRIQEDGGAVEIDMEAAKKVVSGDFCMGERKAVDYEDRQMVFRFDNKGTNFRAKMLIYRITVGSQEVINQLRESYTQQNEEFLAYIAEPDKIPEKDLIIDNLPQKDGTGTGTEESTLGSGGNKYVSNLFAMSSSVMKRAQSAVKKDNIYEGVMGKIWGPKNPAENIDEAENISSGGSFEAPGAKEAREARDREREVADQDIRADIYSSDKDVGDKEGYKVNEVLKEGDNVEHNLMTDVVI